MRIAPLWRFGALAVALAFAQPGLANTAEVQESIKQGRFSNALEQADSLLAANPKDAQLRFLKGLALTELGRANEAVDIFQALTADYPELPEPYNNLAVIYAQQRQYDKARAALEMAIRTHPAYATAHENLGDVYSRLASQAYNKALQIDASNTGAQTKLSMIRNLISASNPGAAADRKPAAAAEPPRVAVAAVPDTATKSPPAALAAAAPPPAPPPQLPSAAASDARISATVLDWAEAWSAKDADAYLAFYADDFIVPGGRSRSAWEAERRVRVGKPGPISVKLENIEIEQSDSRATVRFRQHYNSNTFDASANKTLELVRRGDAWRIHREMIGG